MRDTLHKKVPTVLFHLHEVLQQANLIHSRKQIRTLVVFWDGGRDCLGRSVRKFSKGMVMSW